jgi:CRISPR-associated endonuclease Cas1
MRFQGTASARDGVVVARGYGLKVYVERGHLVVHDGVGRQRNTQRFSRAARELGRLIVLGHSGFVTLDAIRWLHDVGAGFVQLDADGQLLAASASRGPDLAALRRVQALAATGPAGIDIARDLLLAKVGGQRALLEELPAGAQSAEALDETLELIGQAQQLGELLIAEARAANFYWEAWSSLPIPFPEQQATRLPDHWRTFGQRASMLTSGPRLATNPSGAILNYLYALLEAETIFACHAVGIDPGVGIFHTDQRGRASMALDAMEAARPTVDAYVLALLTQRTLSTRDFVETRHGSCRLHPRMTMRLAGTCAAWREQIAPIVERVAHRLVQHSTSPLPRLTPLTRSNWKAAWDQRRPDRIRRHARAGALTLPETCQDCGASLASTRHRYCERCRSARWQRDAERGRQNAAQTLAALRSEQRDPGHGGRAAKLRGSKNATHQRAIQAWAGERPDPSVFAGAIMPGLRAVSIAELASATGLSEHYCSLIRLGKRVPHPRHWELLRGVATHGTASNKRAARND